MFTSFSRYNDSKSKNKQRYDSLETDSDNKNPKIYLKSLENGDAYKKFKHNLASSLKGKIEVTSR